MKTETLSICNDCNGVTYQQRCGDEGWTVCGECGTVEGETTEMTEEEYEALNV